jgi:hypothetical protein
LDRRVACWDGDNPSKVALRTIAVCRLEVIDDVHYG